MKRVQGALIAWAGFATGLLGLVALLASGCSQGAGCTKDTDCKGDRICDYATGRCVNPGGEPDGGGSGDGGSMDAGAPDGGSDAGTPDGGGMDAGMDAGTLACREGGPCEPNKYSDTPGGTLDTSGFRMMFLRTQNGTVRANQGGDVLRRIGFAGGRPIGYWWMTALDDQLEFEDLFPGGTIRTNRLYVFFGEDGTPLSGQPRIIDTDPAQPNWSPLYQVVKVHVVAGYTAGTILSVETVQRAANDPTTGLLLEPTNEVRALWAVDPSVGVQQLQDQPGYPRLVTVYFGAKEVSAYEVPGGRMDGTLPAVPAPNPETAAPRPLVQAFYQFFEPPNNQPCLDDDVAERRFSDPDYTPLALLRWVTVPTCTGLPQDAASVEAEIQAGTFTVTDQRHVFFPIQP